VSKPASASWAALGTTASVLVTDPARLNRASSAVARELDAIDRACSRFREDSELVAVNRAAGRPVRVGELLVEAVEGALRAAELTDGDVDPTVGRALRLAGYDRDFAAIRDDGPRVSVVHAPRWRTVHVDRTRGLVRVVHGVELDLGATAKALAADRAARVASGCVDAGVLVSLGGDIAVCGTHPSGGWPIRVSDDHAAHPDAPGAAVAITAGGLATSSITVRRWRRAGQALHHILDPRTGLPAPVVWRTVSVAAGSCLDANIATTAAIVRGASAPRWLAGLGLPARLVALDGTVLRVGAWPEEGS
jgi:thiamine biosynthesis lipoprotein